MKQGFLALFSFLEPVELRYCIKGREMDRIQEYRKRLWLYQEQIDELRGRMHQGWMVEIQRIEEKARRCIEEFKKWEMNSQNENP
jgi:hypothetical protein